MGRITMSRHVAAPVERTFDVFSDLDKAAERVSGIVRVEKHTEGPTAAGTRFKSTRVMFKREAAEEMEVSAFDPPRSFTISAESCGALFESTYRFQPQDDGTKVTFEMTTRARTFGAKLLTPLGWLMAGTMKKAIAKDLDDLKTAAESDA